MKVGKRRLKNMVKSLQYYVNQYHYIICNGGSSAMKRILDKGLMFLCVMLTVVITSIIIPQVVHAEGNKVLGDVNGDGDINATDTLSVLKHAAKISTLNSNQQSMADVNKDGKLNATDALWILKYAARIIDSFDDIGNEADKLANGKYWISLESFDLTEINGRYYLSLEYFTRNNCLKSEVLSLKEGDIFSFSNKDIYVKNISIDKWEYKGIKLCNIEINGNEDSNLADKRAYTEMIYVDEYQYTGEELCIVDINSGSGHLILHSYKNAPDLLGEVYSNGKIKVCLKLSKDFVNSLLTNIATNSGESSYSRLLQAIKTYRVELGPDCTYMEVKDNEIISMFNEWALYK